MNLIRNEAANCKMNKKLWKKFVNTLQELQKFNACDCLVGIPNYLNRLRELIEPIITHDRYTSYVQRNR